MGSVQRIRASTRRIFWFKVLPLGEFLYRDEGPTVPAKETHSLRMKAVYYGFLSTPSCLVHCSTRGMNTKIPMQSFQ